MLRLFILVLLLNAASAFAQPERFTIHSEGWPNVGMVGETIFLQPENPGPGTYSWDLGDGRTTTGTNPEVDYTFPGVFIVTATYTDEEGNTSSFQRYAFINDPAVIVDFQNEAPFLFLNQPHHGATFPENAEICFQGHGSDPEQEAVTLYWDFDDGDLRQGETEPKKQYLGTGSRFPKMWARDATGYTQFNLAFVELFIYAEQAPPDGKILKPVAETFAFNQQVHQVTVGQPVCLEGSVVDADTTDGFTAFWNIYGSSQATLTGFTPEPQIWEAGFYDVFLEVGDAENRFDPVQDKITIWVRDGNHEPENVSITSPDEVVTIGVDEAVGLSGYAEDRDGDPLTYLWEVGDGRTLEGRYIDQLSYTAPGLYQINLTVEDGQGGSTPAPRSGWVNVVDPQLVCEFEAPLLQDAFPEENTLTGVVGMSHRFRVEHFPREGETITQYFWDFSHGLIGEGASPEAVTFAEPGFYHVRAFAQNQCGLWFMLRDWLVFISTEGNLPPDGTIISPTANARNDRREPVHAVPLGESVTLQGAQFDPDGQLPLSTHWLFGGEFYAVGEAPDPIPVTTLGEYALTYHVNDAAGNKDEFQAQMIIKGIDLSLKPQATIAFPDGDIVALPGEPLYFEALGKDPNGLDLSFEWDFGSAANTQTATGNLVTGIVFEEPSPEGEPYVVRVSAVTQFTSQETPSEIRITVKAFTDAELEPNNNLDEAAEIQRGSYRDLTLEDGDEADFFRFTVSTDNRDLQLNLNGESGVTPVLYRRMDGQWQPVSTPVTQATAGGLVLEGVEAGEYALEVRALGATKMGLSYSMGIATLLPSLYLPFIVEDGNLASNIGLINPTNAAAELSLTGLSETGEALSEIEMELAGGNRLNLSSDTLFGDPEIAGRVRWVRVRSTTRMVGYTNTSSIDNTQLMSSGALTSLSPKITVPHIAAPENGWYTRAILVNALDSTQELNFQGPDSQTKISDMAPFNQSDFRFSNELEGQLPGWGSFGQAGDEPGLAGVEIFGRTDERRIIAAIEMSHNSRNNPNFNYRGNELYYTHIAIDRDNWWTGISLINLSEGETAYTITGYNSQGESKAVVTGSLEAGGKLLSTARALFGEAEVDWVKVESDGTLAGFELFGSHELDRMAGFKAAGHLADTLYFPHVEPTSSRTWTGISILNVADNPVNITLTAFGDQGQALAQIDTTLGARTKLVKTAQALFADVGYPLDTTYIRVTADERSLAGFELFGTLNPEAGGLGELLAGLAAIGR